MPIEAHRLDEFNLYYNKYYIFFLQQVRWLEDMGHGCRPQIFSKAIQCALPSMSNCETTTAINCCVTLRVTKSCIAFSAWINHLGEIQSLVLPTILEDKV